MSKTTKVIACNYKSCTFHGDMTNCMRIDIFIAATGHCGIIQEEIIKPKHDGEEKI